MTNGGDSVKAEDVFFNISRDGVPVLYINGMECSVVTLSYNYVTGYGNSLVRSLLVTYMTGGTNEQRVVGIDYTTDNIFNQ